MPNFERRPERRGGPAGLVLLGLMSLSWAPAQAQFAPHGPQVQINAHATGYQSGAVVAVGPSGDLFVVWHSPPVGGSDEDETCIQGRRLDGLGRPLGDEVQLNTYTTGFQYDSAAAALAAGGFVATWQSDGSFGSDSDRTSIQARRIDAAGEPVGGDFQVNSDTSGYQIAPSVAGLADGGFVVVWHSIVEDPPPQLDDRIRARRFDADGAPLGPEFPVPVDESGRQGGPAVAADGEGGFVVSWTSSVSSGSDTSGASVQARRWDDDGQPLGVEFQVNTFTPQFQGAAAVAMDPIGDFVVAWLSEPGAGPYISSIRAQRFGAAATPIGPEIVVASDEFDYLGGTSVAGGGSSGFVVVWDDYYDVSARGYRDDGTPLAGEFAVNSYIIGQQAQPSVVADRSGNPTVVWTSRGSFGPDQDLGSIQAQFYDALFRDGVETGDASRWSAVAP